MVKAMRTALLAASFLVGVITVEANNLYSHVTLKGVSAFSVLAEDLDPHLKRYGITKQGLQTAIELRLRRAGLPVRNDVIYPHLYVNVNSLMSDDGTASIAIHIEFKQLMYFEQNPMLKIPVTTWSTGKIALYGVQRLGELVDDVSRDVDEFANDFLRQNPRR